MQIIHNQSNKYLIKQVPKRLKVLKLLYFVINYVYIAFWCCSNLAQTVYKIYKLLFTTLSKLKMKWYYFVKIKIFFCLKLLFLPLLNTSIYLCLRAMTFYMLMIGINNLVAAGVNMKGIIAINELEFWY